MRIEQCYACANPKALKTDVRPADNLPLCERHFNWWVVCYLGEEAPCSAHLIKPEEPR